MVITDVFSCEEVMESDTAFYNLLLSFQVPVGQLMQEIAADVYSDFFGPTFLGKEGVPSGFFCAYPLAENTRRQLITFRHYFKALQGNGAALQQLRLFSAQRQPVKAQDGFYLNRIFVRKSSRGTGLAQELMAQFEQKAAAYSNTAYLHVHVANESAIRFYQKLDFRFLAPDSREFAYKLMFKTL